MRTRCVVNALNCDRGYAVASPCDGDDRNLMLRKRATKTVKTHEEGQSPMSF